MNEIIVNTKVGKISTTLGNHDSRIFIVNSRLGEYVRKTREDKGFSVDDVQNNSRRGGRKGISAAYVNKIENDASVNPTTPKLEALADGLQVTHEEIFAVARGSKPEAEKINNEKLAAVSFGYPGMPKQKKEKLDPLIDLLEREYQRIMKEKGE